MTTTRSAVCRMGRSARVSDSSKLAAYDSVWLIQSESESGTSKTFLERGTSENRNACSPMAAGLRCRFFARRHP